MRPTPLWLSGILIATLTACTSGPRKEPLALEEINSVLNKASVPRPTSPPQDAILQSLLPPATTEMPRERDDLAQRFDLTVTNAPAPQVLNALVNGTRYSMVIHPGVTQPVSLSLREVTIPEVLNSMRELYGYDYRIEGTLIYVLPASLQTQLFKVEYLTQNRRGSTDMRVSNNAVMTTGTTNTGGGGGGGGGGAGAAGGAAGGAGRGPSAGASGQSTIVETNSSSDFWRELFASVSVLVSCGPQAPGQAPGGVPAATGQPIPPDTLGCEGSNGRRLIVSPQSGTILVRAMPDELKNVSRYLRASQLSVERQVLIEAKILEVALKDGYETGINWAAFFTRNGETAGIGLLTPGAILGTAGTGVIPSGNAAARAFPTPLTAGNTVTGAPLGAAGRVLEAAGVAAGSIFGIAIQGKNFAALLTFLDSQGVVHTLSSPRIATMNNQKAVLKVGTDQLFVTRITGGSSQAASTGTAPTITSPTFEVQSFFSGIALDVTPRIGEDGAILLHVRPSVTDVTQQLSTFNLGVLGNFTIPLVANQVSETDSVIRATDGQIVAIGGLMRVAQKENRNQVPGVGDLPFLGAAFRNVSQGSEKRELVILLKPTIVQGDDTWARNALESRDRIRTMERGFSWGGRAEVFGSEREGSWKPPQ